MLENMESKHNLNRKCTGPEFGPFSKFCLLIDDEADESEHDDYKSPVEDIEKNGGTQGYQPIFVQSF